MEKDLLEIMEKVKKINKELEDKSSVINNAIKQKCSILIQKDEKGIARTSIEGNRLSILVTLAGLEKAVLENIKSNDIEFECIKQCVGSLEVL